MTLIFNKIYNKNKNYSISTCVDPYLCDPSADPLSTAYGKQQTRSLIDITNLMMGRRSISGSNTGPTHLVKAELHNYFNE